MNQKTKKEEVRRILELIVTNELNGESMNNLSEAQYFNQRAIINSIFSSEDYSIGVIILRLTVIDSLYSTNASYSYFSFDEMAQAIWKLGSRKDAREFFADIVRGKNNGQALFDKKYGIRKNLDDGGMQNSLLSKYAYYELLQDKNYHLGFPIYDSLAREMCPKTYKSITGGKLSSFSDESTPKIKDYVDNLNTLRDKLFGNEDLFMGFQQFDILDAYLWRMGKFNGGNLSLLLDKPDYEKFIKNIEMNNVKNEKFNDKVRDKLKELDDHPFKNCSTEKYMTALRDHWREFYVE